MELKEIYINNDYGKFCLANIIPELKSRILNEFSNYGQPIMLSFTLFGSYCRNEQTDESDIDLCLIYNHKNISELNINLIVDKIADDFLDKYGIIFNILCFPDTYYQKNKNTSRLFKDIEREGITC